MEEFQDYRYILDDFQHQIENKIRNHKNEPDFPQMDEKLSQEELDDFLFDYQAALDSEGTERTQYTIAGVLIALPIIVLSAFPEERLSGCVFWFCHRLIAVWYLQNNDESSSTKQNKTCERRTPGSQCLRGKGGTLLTPTCKLRFIILYIMEK